MHVAAWLHRVEDVPQFQQDLLQWLGAGAVVDSSLCYANHKRAGFPLVDGRRDLRMARTPLR